ncbi:MAG: protein translocase subunit SecA [Micavibrio sp.]|nr:MAG: protein translocase subunit SecA [Micavibrio sp.]
MLNMATKIFGSSNDRTLKALGRHVAPINALEPQYESMDDDELRAQTSKFRQRLENGEPLDNLMHESFAVVREAAKRTLGQRHYDEQLIGGVVLHEGKIAEMKTGEGKTLVATLPVYLNALSGKGVHVVTVNEYLAERDAEWMGQIYSFLGLTTGCVTSRIKPPDRGVCYQSDVTYGTNNEFGFDYLRDNMRFNLELMVQRPFNFAIVDEVDSILIDEARTPLVISGPAESSVELYTQVDKMIIPKLEDQDFEVDEKHKTIILTEEGTEHVENVLRETGLLEEGTMYDVQNINLVHHVNQALRANKLFHRDTDYIIKDNKVILIDEFTGRMMDGRRLSEGLHQALEAKEGVEIQNENQTLASITFQNYFRLYPKLAGMTGTALTEAGEFMEIYNLGVVAMPTHVDVERLDYEDQIFKSMQEKEEAIADLVKECQERKQPVLVGTVSIEKSEQLSAKLKKQKIPHKVLNARHHEQEAYIVSQAGHPGAVTIATNMAGRGTDIQLGGNAEMRIKHEIDEGLSEDKRQKAIEKIEAEIERDKVIVKEAGGLYIVGTERHESRRIDNQLRGRSGRQGDPGASIFFLSVEDDLMRIFAGDKLEGLLANSKIGLKEGEALEHPLISKMLERAQAKVESMHFDIRKNLLKFDNVMNDQRKVIYEQRLEIMKSDDIEDMVRDMRHDIIEDIVGISIPPQAYAEKWNTEVLHNEAIRLLGLDLPISEWAKEEGIADTEITERIMDISDKHIAKKAADNGIDLWRRAEKGIVLQMLDQHWKEHLLNLDHLRQGINLRAFGQRDPLNEYKTEAFGAFESMLDMMRESVTQTLSLVEISIQDGRVDMFMPGMEYQEQDLNTTRQDPAEMGTGSIRNRQQRDGQTDENVQPFPEKRAFDEQDPTTWGKVPRNSPCPCGSSKKFKQCHGKIG